MGRLFVLLFTGLKFSKVLLTGLSMVASIAIYALVFGWKFATAFVGLLAIRGLGSYAAARYKGLRPGAMVIIPFFGTLTGRGDAPRDAQTDAFIALAGPVVGTLSSLVCYLLAQHHEAQWLLAVAYSSFFFNLICLLPVGTFDGGRILAVLSPRLWLLGVPLLVGLFVYVQSPVILIAGFLAWPRFVQAWKYRADDALAAEYFAAPSAVKWEYGSYYVVLLSYLAVTTHDVHAMLAGVKL